MLSVPALGALKAMLASTAHPYAQALAYALEGDLAKAALIGGGGVLPPPGCPSPGARAPTAWERLRASCAVCCRFSTPETLPIVYAPSAAEASRGISLWPMPAGRAAAHARLPQDGDTSDDEAVLPLDVALGEGRRLTEGMERHVSSDADLPELAKGSAQREI